MHLDPYLRFSSQETTNWSTFFCKTIPGSLEHSLPLLKSAEVLLFSLLLSNLVFISAVSVITSRHNAWLSHIFPSLSSRTLQSGLQPGRMLPVLTHVCLHWLLCCGILGDLVLLCIMSMCFPLTQVYPSRHRSPHQAQLPFTLPHQAEQLNWYPWLDFQATCSNLGSSGCCNSKMPTGNCLRPWVFPCSETLVQFKFSNTPSFLQKIRQRMILINSYHSPLQMTTLLQWLILSKVHLDSSPLLTPTLNDLCDLVMLFNSPGFRVFICIDKMGIKVTCLLNDKGYKKIVSWVFSEP